MIISAEISGNHGGSIANCLHLIKEAKRIGVSQIKFQRFDPFNLAKKRLGNKAVAKALGHEPSEQELIALYQQTWSPAAWWPRVVKELDDIPWSCSVFSLIDLMFMERLGCAQFKVASFEITDLELIKACAETGKILVLSASKHATINNIMDAVEAADHAISLTVLHATEYYNRPCTEVELLQEVEDMQVLKHALPPWVNWGLSDHSKGHFLANAAANMGAFMIERHLRLPHIDTPDAAFSLTPDEMKVMIDEVAHHTG